MEVGSEVLSIMIQTTSEQDTQKPIVSSTQAPNRSKIGNCVTRPEIENSGLCHELETSFHTEQKYLSLSPPHFPTLSIDRTQLQDAIEKTCMVPSVGVSLLGQKVGHKGQRMHLEKPEDVCTRLF